MQDSSPFLYSFMFIHHDQMEPRAWSWSMSLACCRGHVGRSHRSFGGGDRWQGHSGERPSRWSCIREYFSGLIWSWCWNWQIGCSNWYGGVVMEKNSDAVQKNGFVHVYRLNDIAQIFSVNVSLFVDGCTHTHIYIQYILVYIYMYILNLSFYHWPLYIYPRFASHPCTCLVCWEHPEPLNANDSLVIGQKAIPKRIIGWYHCEDGRSTKRNWSIWNKGICFNQSLKECPTSVNFNGWWTKHTLWLKCMVDCQW